MNGMQRISIAIPKEVKTRNKLANMSSDIIADNQVEIGNIR